MASPLGEIVWVTEARLGAQPRSTKTFTSFSEVYRMDHLRSRSLRSNGLEGSDRAAAMTAEGVGEERSRLSSCGGDRDRQGTRSERTMNGRCIKV